MKIKDQNQGFTLAEFIIAIVILGILSTTVYSKYASLSNSAKIAACKYNQASLETAEIQYYTNKCFEGSGQYTTDLQELTDYLLNNEIPVCPTEGVYKASDNGIVTCSIPTHVRIVSGSDNDDNGKGKGKDNGKGKDKGKKKGKSKDKGKGKRKGK